MEPLQSLLSSGTAMTCLYHGLYGREAVMNLEVVKRVLPSLRALATTVPEAEFRRLVVGVLEAWEKEPNGFPEETALLLRSLVAWRTWGELADCGAMDTRLFKDVNDEFFEGELPPPAAYTAGEHLGANPRLDELAGECAKAWAERRGTVELAEAINAVFGSFQLPTKLWHYCEMRDVHDVCTAEYVNIVSVSLSGVDGPYLEVGCGRGYFARLLEEDLEAPVIATDSEPFEGVERLGYQDALARHAPRVVFCSWMPHGEDWTPAFRGCPSVVRYYLMGPPSVTATPEAWTLPESERANWTAMHLAAADKFNVCKLDSPEDANNSITLLFTRNPD
ncbi:hypothetical protein DIPPA_20915 [Diplonema papillatum]|nr:hypothetical protein DIPPA_20915 [Diplonema papillatum]